MSLVRHALTEASAPECDRHDVSEKRERDGFMTRPAVTFGLVAYNQEKYVAAAIQGAFAQTCPAMEIILSDDCSPDGTFTIMQEMADAYRGPHTVRARREPANVGLVQHMINLARVAEGDLLVIAAGDEFLSRAGGTLPGHGRVRRGGAGVSLGRD